MNSKRETWVDYVKAFACTLVVLGHLLQSMITANVLLKNDLYSWFNTTIYYFHVPLFFICSGYLYQRYSKVNSWETWKKNVIKKAVTLGVPYFVFSFVTWLLKTLFAGSVNNEIGKLGDVFFVHPVSPYWYLYVLFLVFIITPTVSDITGLSILLGVSVVLKLLSIVLEEIWLLHIYAVSRICQNEIWFVLGLMIAVMGIETLRQFNIGIGLFVTFVLLSVLTFRNSNGFISLGMGMIACISVIMISCMIKENRVINWMAEYTMPFFLMHTLFAAPIRIMLQQSGIGSPLVHIVVGIIMSFMGPIVFIKFLEKIKLGWIVYSGRLLSNKYNENN